MQNRFTLQTATEFSQLTRFFSLLDRYFAQDIFPNATNVRLDDADRAYFFSRGYRDAIAALFRRETDPVRIVFLMCGGEIAGFADYVVYASEGGKCFVLEFCVLPEYRNRGAGTGFFRMLRAQAEREGAVFFALTPTNETNRRFWERNGFVKSHKDEYGTDVFVLHPRQSYETDRHAPE